MLVSCQDAGCHLLYISVSVTSQIGVACFKIGNWWIFHMCAVFFVRIIVCTIVYTIVCSIVCNTYRMNLSYSRSKRYSKLGLTTGSFSRAVIW